jgi:hypothetical protein
MQPFRLLGVLALPIMADVGVVCQYISDVCIVCSPRLCQCSLTCLSISFPNFYAVVGGGCEDSSAVEVDVEHGNSVLVAGLKVVYHCHSSQ